MIETKKLCKKYITKNYEIIANNNINISIKNGEIVWVRGVSGAGKSTLLHILANIDTPTSGNVYWQGKDVSTLNENQRSYFRLKNIGLILQSLELLKTQNVLVFISGYNNFSEEGIMLGITEGNGSIVIADKSYWDINSEKINYLYNDDI